MSALDDWTDEVRTLLRLEPIDAELVLDLARDVAHGVLRPAAPLTAYLVGLAVGRGADPRQAVATVTELARRWPPGPAGSADSAGPVGSAHSPGPAESSG